MVDGYLYDGIENFECDDNYNTESKGVQFTLFRMNKDGLSEIDLEDIKEELITADIEIDKEDEVLKYLKDLKN